MYAISECSDASERLAGSPEPWLLADWISTEIIIGPRRDKTYLRVQVPTKRVSNQAPQLQIEISPVASLHILLSKMPITKALIRLRGCAGWSVLFENHKDRFSHVETHMIWPNCFYTLIR